MRKKKSFNYPHYPLLSGALHEGMIIFSLKCKFFLSVDPILDRFCCPGKQTGIYRSFLPLKNGGGGGKHGSVPLHVNPVTLRTAKTLWSFGRPDVNRVKY